jgi:hypothetical protein
MGFLFYQERGRLGSTSFAGSVNFGSYGNGYVDLSDSGLERRACLSPVQEKKEKKQAEITLGNL